MKYLVIILINILFIFPISIWGQLTKLTGKNVYTEEDIYLTPDGARYSTLIKIKFNDNLIDIQKGERDFTLSHLKNSTLNTHLSNLKKKYGNFKLSKIFPESVWGDTLRINKRTRKIVSVPDNSQIVAMKFENLVPIDTLIQYLEAIPLVKYAVPPYVIETLMNPNDPAFINGYQWGLDSIFAREAWDITTGNSNIIISINDLYNYSINQLHPELINKTVSFVSYYGGHGIEVAGVAGAQTNNLLGIASLGWNNTIMLNHKGYEFIDLAINNGADVINFSWRQQEDDSLLREKIYSALAQGVICVAGAGNTVPPPPVVNYPAAYNFGSVGQVIAVSATCIHEGREAFGYGYNYSPGTDPINNPTTAFIDVAAPGVDIYMLYGANSYAVGSGTSLASGLVSALVSLILSIDNSLTPVQVYDIITKTADKIKPIESEHYIYNNGWSRFMGYGRINAWNAVNVATGAPNKPRNLNVTSNALHQAVLTWEANIEPDLSMYRIYRTSTTGGEPTTFYPIGTINAFSGGTPVTSWIDEDVYVGFGPEKLFYKISAIDNTSKESVLSDYDWIQWDHTLQKENGNQENITSVKEFKLYGSYPNPFNPSTIIKYQLPEAGHVKLSVYNVLGKEVAELVNEVKQAGVYEVEFNAGGLPSGVYVYRIQRGSYHEAKKMILTK